MLMSSQEFQNNVVEVLQKMMNDNGTEDSQLDLDVITVEEVSKNHFECTVNYYLQKGYEIIASSCNSKTWKAIMQRKENDKESDK